MNPLFKTLMNKATRLTASGDLLGATAAIQRALGRVPTEPTAPAASPNDRALVIDVQMREVPAFEAPRVIALDSKVSESESLPLSETEGPSSGSGASRFVGGTHVAAVGQRDYKLYVPSAYCGQALPLVVMLHGCTQGPEDFAVGTGMNDEAMAHGFFVLYPAQAQHANPQRCWNWFKHNHQQRDRGEPALLASMTRAVMKEYRVDRDRVYVAGLSAGGAMAAILGDAYPDLFAAVGVHSGLHSGAATDVTSAFAAMQGNSSGMPLATGLGALPGLRTARASQPEPPARQGRSPPTIVFHGDRDNTVHPVNGERVIAACMASVVNGAAGVEREAEHQRGRSQAGREYTRGLHRDASDRVISEHWVVHGAGHAWSGGRPRGSYTDPQGPDATREMVRFFFANARPPSH